jgi:hypothetical protein
MRGETGSNEEDEEEPIHIDEKIIDEVYDD